MTAHCYVLHRLFVPRPSGGGRVSAAEAALDAAEAAESVAVLGVYHSLVDARARVALIAKANAQYPLRPLGLNHWELGPVEDEGFFGHRRVRLWIRPAPDYSLIATDPRPEGTLCPPST